jgi:hypothetical protein
MLTVGSLPGWLMDANIACTLPSWNEIIKHSLTYFHRKRMNKQTDRKLISPSLPISNGKG